MQPFNPIIHTPPKPKSSDIIINRKDTTMLEVECGKTALLVIDVQQGMFGKATPVYGAEQLLQNINTLIDQAHQSGVRVIFIQHCDGHFLVEETADWQLNPALHCLESDTRILKQHSNSFESTSLQGELAANGITTLVKCGMVTHGCVKNSCLGALVLGYRTVLVKDGHSSFSTQAGSLIEEWNKKLAEKGADVVPASEIVLS
jgi:nicotinamidase-related amidase